MLNSHIFGESFSSPVMALALLIGLAVAYVSLWLGKGLVNQSGRQRVLRLVLASLVLGGGYWLQNYLVISSLTFGDSFKPASVFLWLATPLVTAVFAYYITTRFRLSNSCLIAGGSATGLGSAATPLMGLAALDTGMMISLDINFLVFVVLLGTAVSMLGLSAAFQLFRQGFSCFSWKLLLSALVIGLGLTSLQFVVLAGINTGQTAGNQGFVAVQSLSLGLLISAFPLAALMLVLRWRERARGEKPEGYAVEPIYIGLLVSVLILVCLILVSRWFVQAKLDDTMGLTQAGSQAQRHFQDAYTTFRDWRSDHPDESIPAGILDKLESSQKGIQLLLDGGEMDGVSFSAISSHQGRQRLSAGLQSIEALKSRLRQDIRAVKTGFSESDKEAYEQSFVQLSGFFAINRQAASGQLAWVNDAINQSAVIRILFVMAMFSLLAVWYRRNRGETDQQTRLLEDTLKELVLQKGALDQHAIVSIADTSGIITYANDKFCEISGYERDELIGRSHNLLNSGYHSREFFRDLWQTISGGQTWQGEINNRNKAGGCYWVQTTIVPFLDDAGSPYQYISIRTDISQLKQAEKTLWDYNRKLENRVGERTAELLESHKIIEQEKQALEESENRLRMSQRFAKMGSWEWDIEADNIHWTEQVPFLFGYQEGESIESYDDLIRAIDPLDRDAFLEAVDECLSNGAHYDIEHRVTWPDGSVHWLQERGDVVRDEQGQPTRLLGVVADVTRRKQQDQALRSEKEEQATLLKQLQEAQSQLLQSEKMASLGQLAAGVAHEINNPVGYINSNIGTLQQYLGDLSKLIAAYQEAEALIGDPEVRRSLEQLKDQIDLTFIQEDLANLISESQEGVSRVRQIVQDLKDFSHVEKVEWQRADLHRGLDSTLNIVHNELKYKAKVIKEYGELPTIECIPSQLNQVFMNMLVNAGHAIDEQGEIRLRTGSGSDDTVWVEIEDNGKGMTQEDVKRIFDPFFTTKPVGKGTGLGLSISYNIIKKHGGSIGVTSEPGKGTQFKITLPVSQAVNQAVNE